MVYLNRNLQTAKVKQSFSTKDENPKQVLNLTVEKLGPVFEVSRKLKWIMTEKRY